MLIRRRELLIGAGASTVSGEAAAKGLFGARVAGVSVAPPPTGGPFITATTVGSTRADSGDLYRGFRVAIGSQPLQVTALGRWVGPLNGSVHTHNLGIFSQNPVNGQGVLMFGTGVTVDISTGTPGTYKYAPITSNVILQPGQNYWVTSFEPAFGSGDVWYDPAGVNVTTTADAVLVTAATYDPSNNFLNDYGGSGTNHPMVPVNFQYNVGIPGGVTVLNKTPFSTYTIDNLNLPQTVSSSGQIVTGTVTFSQQWVHGLVPAGDTWTYQYYVDGVPTSPILTATDPSSLPVLPWTVNSSTIPDGTHHIVVKILDSQLSNINGDIRPMGNMYIVANSGFNNGSQTIPTAQWSGVKCAGPLPDFIAFDPANPYPVHAPHVIPYTHILPANNPSSPYHSNPGLLLSNSNWWGEALTGSRAQEYFYYPQFTTTLSGGVLIQNIDSMQTTNTPASYQGVVLNNPMDGTRLNSFVSPLSTFIDTEIGDGSWYVVEISGKVSKITNDGTVTTIVGGKRDRTRLTYFSASSDDVEAIQTFVGTWPPGINLGGGNDLCLDPRNSNIMYCCAQVDNWIGMINISTQTVTVYAGVPGAPDSYNEGTANSVHGVGGISGSTLTFSSGGTGFAIGMTIGCDGVLAGTKITAGTGSGPFTVAPGGQSVPGGTTIYGGVASFASPASIVMDSSGTMYISDQNNNAIRRLPSSGVGSPGSVTTLCGGTVAPSVVTPTDWAVQTTFNVTSITWTAGVNGGTGAVVMAAPTTFALGFTARLNGAINTGGSGNPNSVGGGGIPSYIVVGFTDSQHFTIGFAPAGGQYPSITIGTLSGSMTLTMLAGDHYSAPTTVGFSSTWVLQPNSVRFTSAGNIVFSEQGTLSARLINLGASTISRITTFEALLNTTSEQWMWVDVDRLGTCGPVDTMVLAPFNGQLGGGAHANWYSSLAQDRTPGIGIGANQGYFSFDGIPLSEYGPEPQVGAGHYMWAISYSRTEGRLVTTGTAQAPPTFWRITQPSDPAFSYAQSVSNSGFNVLCTGTAGGRELTAGISVPGFPTDIRPSLWGIWGPTGVAYITNSVGHNTFNDLNTTYASTTPGDSGDVALATYIQGGMGGAVPRPEITGNDLANFIYFIRRNTADGGGSGSGIQTPAPSLDPDNAPPIILTISAVRNSSTQITITWTTDKPTIGMTCSGAPLQFAAKGLYSVYATGLESGYGTSHSRACPVLSGVSPVHYTVVVKDMAGNFSYATDHTVT